jgi:hypothetical protein
VRGRALLFAGAAALVGCSSQFADPILREAAVEPDPCLAQVVLQLEGATLASIPRLLQDDFTIEMWINTTDSAPGDYFWEGSALVFADVIGHANDFSAAILNDQFLVAVGVPEARADTEVRSTSTVTTGKWVHVAATRNLVSGVVLVYVDGVLEGSAQAGTNTLADASLMTIGGRAEGTFYTGLLSELRLWNRVRSQSELLADTHRRLSGDEPGLVALYPFDDGGGSIARDLGPNGHDAPFAGPLSWLESDVPFCEP